MRYSIIYTLKLLKAIIKKQNMQDTYKIILQTFLQKQFLWKRTNKNLFVIFFGYSVLFYHFCHIYVPIILIYRT